MELQIKVKTVAPAQTISVLRWLLVLAAIMPVALFGALAWRGYVRTDDEARERLLQASRIVREHAVKVLQTNDVVLDRVADLASRTSIRELSSRQKEVHAALLEITAGVAQARAVTVWDAQGHAVVSNRYFPVARDVSIADRAYFVRHKLGEMGATISEPVEGRLENERIFNISRRLNGPGGEFAGVVTLSISEQYFADFYRDIAADDADLAITLFRSDGELVASYPLTSAVTHKLSSDAPPIDIVNGGTPPRLYGAQMFDGRYRVAAVAQVQPYPIFVAVSRTPESMRAEWRQDLVTLAAVVIPTFLALLVAIWGVLCKAKSEYRAILNWQRETSRRASAEEQLRQLQKYEMLGELTGGLAHDLNNLLQIVSSNTAVISALPRGSDLQPYVSALRRAVGSGTALTRQLLAFARKQPLKLVQTRTAEALPNICELARHSLPNTIELRCEVDPHVCDITADRAELELALLNLVVNARDAMPEGGTITVRARNVAAKELPQGGGKDCVAISVSDTGTGIPEALLERIFEPFFTTKKDKGTGLGLSRVYGYAMQSGGYVTAENKPGGGATLTLYAPKADPVSTPDALKQESVA